MHVNLFIDESGDTGYTRKSSRYFVITAIYTDDVVLLRRIARNIHTYKQDRRKGNILHAYKETKTIKNRLVKELLYTEVHCISFTLDKNLVKVKDPYCYGLERVAKYFQNTDITNICIAKRDTRPSYNNKIIEMFNTYNIRVVFLDPRTEKALQIADFYSWCIFSYLEYDLSEYFLKLKHQITLI